MRGRRGARGKELLSRMARVEKQSDQGLKEPAGQGTAWNLKRKREQSDGDGSLREICENLKCLIVVINNFSQRRRPAAIDSVMEHIANMTERPFSKSDLCILLGACGAIVVDSSNEEAGGRCSSWRSLRLSLSKTWSPTSTRSGDDDNDADPKGRNPVINTCHVPIETRLSQLNMLLEEGNLSSFRSAGENILKLMEQKQQTQSSTLHRNRSGKNSSFKAELQKDLYENQQILSQVLTIDKGHKPMSMDLMREQVIQRQQEDLKKSSEKESIGREVKRLGELVVLPRLSDSLRSLALTRNMTCFPLRTVVDTLSGQANCQILNNSNHFRQCLQYLVSTVPEFVQIFPPDDVVSYESVRVNLQAPYRSVRAKVKATADAASIDREKVLGNKKH